MGMNKNLEHNIVNNKPNANPIRSNHSYVSVFSGRIRAGHHVRYEH